MVKLPPTFNNPLFMLNVVMFGAVIVKAATTFNNAGKDIVVSAAKEAVTAPVIVVNEGIENVVTDAIVVDHVEPKVTNAGSDRVVKAEKLLLKAPVMVPKFVSVNEVTKEPTVENAPPTVVKAPKVIVVRAFVFPRVNAPVMVASEGKLKVAKAWMLGVKAPEQVT